MSTNSSGRMKNVTVIGENLLGLSTAINIQENVPDVHVELVNDEGRSGRNDYDDCIMSTDDDGGNTVTKHPRFGTSYKTDDDDEEHSSMLSCAEGAFSTTAAEPSFTRSLTTEYSGDDVLWLPQSIPGLDDDTTGKGGHYRFWSVLTWYHLYELTQRESSSKTGVRLLPDYILHHWKGTQVCYWWKDLVPDYRQLHHDADHQQSSSGLRYGSSFTTAVINAPRYIQYLSRRFLNCGGRFKGRISSISELSGPCDLLVNCSCSNLHQLGGNDTYHTQHLPAPMQNSLQATNGMSYDQSPGSRLEATTILHKGRPLSVIHSCSYDPDQLITLHWGCGQETARLASDILAGRFIRPTSKL